MAKHGDIWKSDCGKMELRCGRWQDVLEGVECDAVITDPPYGERTHDGQKHERRHKNQSGGSWVTSRAMSYGHWTGDDVLELCAFSAGARGWTVMMTSHDLTVAYSESLGGLDRYVFAPLPAVQRGMNVRLAGDGPSSWTVWVIVSRPKGMPPWGTLPGAYVGGANDHGESISGRGARAVPGGKPLWLMRAIVKDYSRPGDLICDPCAGGGTTLLAAAIEGRRAIGAEMDPVTFEKAVRRLSAGYTPMLFQDTP